MWTFSKSRSRKKCQNKPTNWGSTLWWNAEVEQQSLKLTTTKHQWIKFVSFTNTNKQTSAQRKCNFSTRLPSCPRLCTPCFVLPVPFSPPKTQIHHLLFCIQTNFYTKWWWLNDPNKHERIYLKRNEVKTWLYSTVKYIFLSRIEQSS